MKNKTILVHIHDIKWDIDEECDELEQIELPTAVNLYLNHNEDDNVEDIISDWLTENFGFCHFGFLYEIDENYTSDKN